MTDTPSTSESPLSSTVPSAPESSLDGQGTPETQAAETAPEGQGETVTPEQKRLARVLAEATKKERRAAERERKAAEQARAAEERASKAEADRAAIEALFEEAAKSPDKALALLQRAKFRNVDDLARLLIGMDPEPEAPDAIAKRALERAEQLEAQIRQEREQAEYERAKAHYEALQREHVAKINNFITGAADTYDTIIKTNSQGEVLNRIYKTLQEHKVTYVTPEQELELMQHFANEVENELFNYAQQDYQKLQGFKKLAITTHTNTSGSTSGTPVSPSGTIETTPKKLSTDAVEQAAQQLRDKKPSKFINESLVSSKPLPRELQTSQRKDLALIEDAIKAMKNK